MARKRQPVGSLMGEGTHHKPRRKHPHLATEYQEKGDAGSAADVAKNLRPRLQQRVLSVPQRGPTQNLTGFSTTKEAS